MLETPADTMARIAAILRAGDPLTDMERLVLSVDADRAAVLARTREDMLTDVLQSGRDRAQADAARLAAIGAAPNVVPLLRGWR